jgi:hypothetical protein
LILPEFRSDDKYYPIITGAFYTDDLIVEDWGEISGTTGRNTKVTGMKISGREKMGRGWILLLDQDIYLEKYSKQFEIYFGEIVHVLLLWSKKTDHSALSLTQLQYHY